MTKSIILVGCGVIGSRHLQAIAKINEKLEIHVVEPREEAISVGKSRLDEVNQDLQHEIFWHKNITEIKNPSNLVIIATQAKGRVDLVNQLLINGNKRFLLEKIVCQSDSEYDSLIQNLQNNNAKAWVDASRRYFSSYQKLKEFFKNDEPFYMAVTASYPGLGRDAIHFIDLFSWFSNDAHIQLNGENLIDDVFPNKRGKDLMEFAGTLTGTSKNSFLSMTFFPEGNFPNLVQLVGKDNSFIINEPNNQILHAKTNDQEKTVEFNFEYSSDLTTKIVQDILQKDECLLPTVRYSSYAHKELFRVFNLHLKKIFKQEREICPIT